MAHRFKKFFLVMLGASIATSIGLAAANERDSIRLSTFSTDVTIPLGHRCMGVLRTKATRIVDPLYAHGFVLQGAGKPLVLVAVDWCEIRNDSYDRWREVLARVAGTSRERVLVTSLHQHDAPVVDAGAERFLAKVDLGGELFDEKFHEETLERVAASLLAGMKTSRGITQGIFPPDESGRYDGRRVACCGDREPRRHVVTGDCHKYGHDENRVVECDRRVSRLDKERDRENDAASKRQLLRMAGGEHGPGASRENGALVAGRN